MTAQKPKDCPKCQMPRKGTSESPCGAPLMSGREMDSGLCNSCAEGWASPESYPASWTDPPDTELVPRGDDALMISYVVRVAFEMGLTGCRFSTACDQLHSDYAWAYKCGKMMRDEEQRRQL